MMKRFDVEEIQAKGEEFNTDFHEAVTHFPAQKEEDNFNSKTELSGSTVKV